MHSSIFIILTSIAWALAFPLASMPDASVPLFNRASTCVNPASVTGTTCTAAGKILVSHDINVAVLGICGGIAGTITKCGGAPTSTTSASGTAKFALTTTATGATINISKGRWEQCVRAAQAVCGNSPFTSTCIGGASTGNVAFTLSAN